MLQLFRFFKNDLLLRLVLFFFFFFWLMRPYRVYISIHFFTYMYTIEFCGLFSGISDRNPVGLNTLRTMLSPGKAQIQYIPFHLGPY